MVGTTRVKPLVSPSSEAHATSNKPATTRMSQGMNNSCARLCMDRYGAHLVGGIFDS